jgi:hypothetical protein
LRRGMRRSCCCCSDGGGRLATCTCRPAPDTQTHARTHARAPAPHSAAALAVIVVDVGRSTLRVADENGGREVWPTSRRQNSFDVDGDGERRGRGCGANVANTACGVFASYATLLPPTRHSLTRASRLPRCGANCTKSTSTSTSRASRAPQIKLQLAPTGTAAGAAARRAVRTQTGGKPQTKVTTGAWRKD